MYKIIIFFIIIILISLYYIYTIHFSNNSKSSSKSSKIQIPNFKLQKTQKVKRIITNYPNIKYIKPINKNEIISTVKYAIKNNYKITTISGGHSYYFMRHFDKFNTKNLIVIDISNMKTITHKNNILNIEAGVTAGDIRKFNYKLKNKWCLYGNCDTVGLGFWINGGQFSGVDYYSGWKNG